MEQLTYLIQRVEKMDEKFDNKLDDIIVQTTKTNGRVTTLEREMKGMKAWQQRLLWCLIGAAVSAGLLVLDHYLK